MEQLDMRLDQEVEDDIHQRAEARSALEDALALAHQIDRLLNAASAASPDSDAFRVRLARAHTLSLVDQLSELVGSRTSALPPTASGVHELAPQRDDDGQANGTRRTWR